MNTILAIDLGKYNSVLCWYEPATHAAFRTVATTPAELRSERVRQPDVMVVCEACSQAGWVHDLGEELRLSILMASTTGDAWHPVLDCGRRIC